MAVPLNDFANTFSSATELSSIALGGTVLSVSDEFFAGAYNLLLVDPPHSLKGQFGPNGALYSGWESRRHNQSHDWCVIKLGTPGTVLGFDIDTTHFNGNEAPLASVAALYAPNEEPSPDDVRWSEILPKVVLGPSSRHLFRIPKTPCVTHVKLIMYPDGGIARFRVYGNVKPVFSADISESFDLAHVFAGGSVLFTSDQHYGVGSNLILPGRGKDMGDGWETKRSRQQGHCDWAIIKLGVPGHLEQAEIDTAHFKGNFPESCELHATSSATVDKDQTNVEWTPILPRTKLGPHRQHSFQLGNAQNEVYTHVKLTIYPDGGVKRVRLIGRRAAEAAAIFSSSPESVIPVMPLTPERFEEFGKVIEAYSHPDAAPRGTRVTPANQGTAVKFHKLALLESSYPFPEGATTGLSVYRCDALEGVGWGGTVEVKVLERHPYTTQAFIPMGGDGGGGAGFYLVVVANSVDGKPDLTTLRAFYASSGRGVMYNTGVWHQPMTVLGKMMDFTCVETQIGNGNEDDCEMLEMDPALHGVYKLRLPDGVSVL